MWKIGSVIGATIALLVHPSTSPAQNLVDSTWVNTNGGSDTNPCTRLAPCRTFHAAVAKTAPGGTIGVLEPGEFLAGGAPLTINKSITIVADGLEARLMPPVTTAIVINAAATDKVILRGLTINGRGSAELGIVVQSAKSVVVDRTSINNMLSHGISVEPSAGTVQVAVLDSIISDNRNGMSVAPAGTGAAIVALDRVKFTGNAGVAVQAVGANARVRMANSHVTANGTGLLASAGATLQSIGPSNFVSFNAPGGNGAFTGTVPFF